MWQEHDNKLPRSCKEVNCATVCPQLSACLPCQPLCAKAKAVMPPSPLISQTCRSLSLGVSMFARPNGGYFSNMCNPNRVYASLILFINASRSFGFAAIIRRTSHGKYFLKASAVHNMWHLMFLVDSLHVHCEATKSSCTYGLAFSMPVGDPLAHSCNIAIKDAISKANTFRIAGFDCAR